MRIGIVGTHGVGKTALARALADALGLPLIEECARRAAAELGHRSMAELLGDPGMLREFQVYVLGLQLREEEGRPGGFVADRTALDCLAYWIAYGLDGTELGRSYEECCEAHVRRGYDLLVYVPPEFPCEEDGFRDADEGLRARVDGVVRSLLDRVRPWVPVATARGSPEERLRAVLAVVEAGRGLVGRGRRGPAARAFAP
jgi:nicotinamide riboside kinase